MQRNFLSPLTLRAGALACAALLAAPAPAAELGDVAVRSFVGQQLAADIELVGLTLDEMNGLPVRLASADVYSGANLTPDPVLASLRLSVVRRDQRWFLHMTTLRPVDANHLYLYLELGSGEHQVVREATVWLAPDPHPAPPPVVVAAPELPVKAAPPKSVAKVAPKPALSTSQAMAPKTSPAAAMDAPQKATPSAAMDTPQKTTSAAAADTPQKTTSAAATEPPPKAAADAAQPDAALIAAIARARHPPAPGRAASAEQPAHAADTPAIASAPAAAHGASADKQAAPHAASAARPAMVHEAVNPSMLPTRSAEAAPASCPVKPLRMAAKECIVLDSHSVVISSKIDELEDKVRVLQTALAGPPPAPKLAPAAAAARAAGHASLPKLKYRDKKDKPVEHGPTTSLLIGAGVAALALVAGVLFWLRKRKAKKGGGPLKIWQSWRKQGAQPADAGLPEATPEAFMEPQ